MGRCGEVPLRKLGRGAQPRLPRRSRPDGSVLMCPVSGGGRPWLLVKDGAVRCIAFSNQYPDDGTH